MKEKLAVFLESEPFGYEEFKAESKNEAFKILESLYDSVLFQRDGIERKIGIFLKPREEK